MIISLITGVLIGLILAIPPGPVAVTAIKMGLNKGPREGTFVGLGTGLVDFIFCLVAGFATSAALSLVSNFTSNHPFLTLSFQFLIVLGIMIYGFTHLKPKHSLIESVDAPKKSKSRFFHYLTTRGSFLLGIAVSLANMANPTFIPSLAYITLNVQNFGLIESSALGTFAFALGFGFGNFSWIYIVTRTLIYFKPRMSDKFMLKIQQFAGVTLIGFGTFLGWRIFEITKWSELVRLIFAL